MYETEENKQNTNSYTSEYGTYQMPDIKVSQMETEGKKTSYSVAGFVLSIIAFFTSFTIFLGLINGILGLVFSLYGIIRIRDPQKLRDSLHMSIHHNARDMENMCSVHISRFSADSGKRG